MKPYLLIINDLENIMFELSVTVELLIVCISRKRLERIYTGTVRTARLVHQTFNLGTRVRIPHGSPTKLVASVKRAMECVGVFSCLIHDADATSTYHQPRSK